MSNLDASRIKRIEDGESFAEIMTILRKNGAEIGAYCYCLRLFGHNRIDRLNEREQALLAIHLRGKMVEAAMRSGHQPHGRDSIQ